ncbi:hypothetical protein [Rudaeicoccus suwonensis]|uniref:Lipoprotein n=1 Tax=Rudaeicoccus suwonensis TaxID=657409 RepID=A0A561EBC7_9MICO|nr:hypothetical protein [Rudaeicoccus suwonensis]TWE12908.1 hypothetical protein BKA23_1730 [Rudaeicoccus suwonensis]
MSPLGRALCAGVVVALSAAVIGCSASSRFAATQSAAAIGTSGARQAALNLARDNGDGAPRTMVAVRTTRSAVQASAPSLVSSGGAESVVVVSMTGHFVGYAASGPSGAAIPTGSALTVVYNPATRAVTDWSITDNSYQLPGTSQTR